MVQLSGISITNRAVFGEIGGGPKTYATFNPSDKAAGALLSNNDLTITAVHSDWQVARATQGKSTGKWVFECVYDSEFWNGIGFANSTFTLGTGYYLGSVSMSTMFCSTQGYLSAGISNHGTAPTKSAGTKIMIALDLDAGKGWMIAGNSPVQGDPTTGSSPTWTWTSGTTIYPAAGVFYGHGSTTLNFGATAFTNTVPSGFNSGWYE